MTTRPMSQAEWIQRYFKALAAPIDDLTDEERTQIYQDHVEQYGTDPEKAAAYELEIWQIEGDLMRGVY